MTSRPLLSTLIVLGLVSAFGAGCTLPSASSLRQALGASDGSSSSTSEKELTGPKPANFDGLSPSQAAQKIAFVGGDVIVMQQGFHGIGGQLAQTLGFGGGSGERDVVIRSFAPQNSAAIEWKLNATVAPDAKDHADTGARQTTGSLVNAKLQSGHKLYLPGYWPQKNDADALDTSLIWLSSQVYADLTKNKVTTLDLGVTDETLSKSFAGSAQVQTAVEKIRELADSAGAHKDIYTMTADDGPSTMSLLINGKEVTVQVIQARNWFGEITVLDNKMNPLVLDVELDPLMLAAADATTGSSFMQTALGYHISELKDIQE